MSLSVEASGETAVSERLGGYRMTICRGCSETPLLFMGRARGGLVLWHDMRARCVIVPEVIHIITYQHVSDTRSKSWKKINPLHPWCLQGTRHFLFPSVRGELSESLRNFAFLGGWWGLWSEPRQLAAQPTVLTSGYSQVPLSPSLSHPLLSLFLLLSVLWQHLESPTFPVQEWRITRCRRQFKSKDSGVTQTLLLTSFVQLFNLSNPPCKRKKNKHKKTRIYSPEEACNKCIRAFITLPAY